MFRCKQYDCFIVFYITHFAFLRNERFFWENIKISQNAMALIANMPKLENIVEISHLATQLTVNCCMTREVKCKISQIASMNCVTKNRFD